MNPDDWASRWRRVPAAPKFKNGDVVRTPTSLLGTVRKRVAQDDDTWLYDVRLHHLHLVLCFREADLGVASAVDRLADLA
jgi:hypothetical protein